MTTAPIRLIKQPEVTRITTLSRATIYQWMAEKKFPAPLKLGDRSIAWREQDIVDWVQSRADVSLPSQEVTE